VPVRFQPPTRKLQPCGARRECHHGTLNRASGTGRASRSPPQGGPRAEGEVADEAIEVHRRADFLGTEAGRGRHGGDVCVPPGRDQGGDVLHLEEEVREPGRDRDPRVAATAEENAKLKRLVADLSLDKHILSEIIRKKVYAGTRVRTRGVDAEHLRSKFHTRVPAGADFTRAVRPSQSSSRPGAATASDARSGAGPHALWRSACARAAAT
jgi:hypothetical protein